jgi:tetratricopeptide (TPR) repeat protein
MRNPARLAATAFTCATLLAGLLNPRALAQSDELNRLYPPAYVQVLEQAIRTFMARDFEGALKKVAEADRMFPDTVYALNLRGAVAIERKQMEEGAKYCRQALAKEPKFFPALFNLAEIPFALKKYPESRKGFQDLLEADPKNELLQYRVYLTYLLEGNMDEAKRALEAINFPSNTAAYYYAHAAWEFAHGNEEKALGWVKSGDWVFPKSRNANFADVMYDLGWLKRDVPTPE